MNTMLRKSKFWVRNCLEDLGMSVGAALVWLLFMTAGFMTGGSGEYSGDTAAIFEKLLSLFPYYLLMVGGFVTVIVVIGHFQVYFSVLLSMNATRKYIAWGIILSTAGNILAFLMLAAVIWKLAPGEIAASGWKLMPLFTGALFMAAAGFLVLGVVIIRWGKIGMIIVGCVCALIGGCFGASIPLSNGNMIEKFVHAVTDGDFRVVAAAGIILYLAAGVFVLNAARKMEVRV